MEERRKRKERETGVQGWIEGIRWIGGNDGNDGNVVKCGIGKRAYLVLFQWPSNAMLSFVAIYYRCYGHVSSK